MLAGDVLQNSALGLQHYWQETPEQVFYCELWEILKHTFYTGHLRTTVAAFNNFLQISAPAIRKTSKFCYYFGSFLSKN